MKKTFTINGRQVTFETCTAINPEIGYTKPTNALYIHDESDEFGNGDGVIFGEAMPKTDAEATNLLFDYEPFTDSAILATVKKEEK